MTGNDKYGATLASGIGLGVGSFLLSVPIVTAMAGVPYISAVPAFVPQILSTAVIYGGFVVSGLQDYVEGMVG